ncbi:MAG: Flp pilus assembly complex ATPase component TadA [Candidatus Riflebacteria bacterium]|nr:Flp pilus assembly complex ATPase component TadA [Candidatus Riflebacteria bacterium]
MDLKSLIETVHKQGGAEIHLKRGSPPLIRQNKNLKKLKIPNLIDTDLEGIVEEFLTPTEKQKFQDNRDFEGNFFDKATCNFRLNIFRSQGQIQAKVHIIRQEIPTLEEIGFPDSFGQLSTAKSGLIIITGPSRSGISTSLSSMIEKINRTRESHILILEDPIEFVFKPKKSVISHRHIKKDVLSIEQGITFAKRIDADVLVIGEIRGEPPIRAIMDYVNGGHLVILQMQTLGIQNTLEKILNTFPESDREPLSNMFSHDLLGICSQALLYNPGKMSMIPIHEVLIINNTIRGIIQKGRVTQVESNMGSAGEGSRLFDAHVGKLVRDGSLQKEVAEGFLTMYRGLRG